jgi:methylated-DNA-[protein]-cysteine S-methyltransferase
VRPTWTVTESPIGDLRVVARGAMIAAIEFSPFRSPSTPGSPPGSPPGDSSGDPSAGPPIGDREDDAPLLRSAVDQLSAYFARDLKEFDLPLAPHGTAFQLRVWDQLVTIGYGETASYGEIARRLGMTNAASRAVGLANGRNPIPIVIPCHRVIGANGTLTGYGGGLPRKQLLLELEQDSLF